MEKKSFILFRSAFGTEERKHNIGNFNITHKYILLGPAALESRSMPKDFSGKVKTKTKGGTNTIAVNIRNF